jgi:hypothetical protein
VYRLGLEEDRGDTLADAGASDRQMMALFDWSNESMAVTYTAKARKRKLATDGTGLAFGGLSWDGLRTNNGVAPSPPGRTFLLSY